jgi:hypothetical protein
MKYTLGFEEQTGDPGASTLHFQHPSMGHSSTQPVRRLGRLGDWGVATRPESIAIAPAASQPKPASPTASVGLVGKAHACVLNYAHLAL